MGAFVAANLRSAPAQAPKLPLSIHRGTRHGPVYAVFRDWNKTGNQSVRCYEAYRDIEMLTGRRPVLRKRQAVERVSRPAEASTVAAFVIGDKLNELA